MSWVIIYLIQYFINFVRSDFNCINIDSCVWGRCCGHRGDKCCRELSMPQCVSAGGNSQCGWFYGGDGCGYCYDWGNDDLCGSFPFGVSGRAEGHCNPAGAVNKPGSTCGPTAAGTPAPCPTQDPTIDPTIDPTRDPTIDPTIDPTTDPTTDPSRDPTKDPTNDPTADPIDSSDSGDSSDIGGSWNCCRFCSSGSSNEGSSNEGSPNKGSSSELLFQSKTVSKLSEKENYNENGSNESLKTIVIKFDSKSIFSIFSLIGAVIITLVTSWFLLLSKSKPRKAHETSANKLYV